MTVSPEEPDRAGACPFCGAAIGPAQGLIEYEADGERRLFAECPDCRDVVDPHAAARYGRGAALRRELAEE